MAAKVFISYRRDDSAGHAGRVHDRLEREFGSDLLFMDVDAIPLGVNFIKVLREEVVKCDVLLALIGPNWLDARDEEGNRRLDNPKDFLRIEIATALQRDISVIPILLGGARMPKADQLPKDLEELAVRNGLDIRHASFHGDMDKLVRGLKNLPGQVGASSSPRSLPEQRGENEETKAKRRGEGRVLVDAAGDVASAAAPGGDAPSEVAALPQANSTEAGPEQVVVILGQSLLIGASGWIYIGTRIGPEWKTTEAEGGEPPLTIETNGLPIRGLTYSIIRDVFLREQLPQETGGRPVMSNSKGVIPAGSRVKLDDVREIKLEKPSRTWVWAHTTLVE
jgi:hypothetical protein